MATSAEFKDFVLERLEQCARECLNENLGGDFSAYFSLGFPFNGAREHYIIDIENTELLSTIIQSTLPFLPVPKPKKSKK